MFFDFVDRLGWAKSWNVHILRELDRLYGFDLFPPPLHILGHIAHHQFPKQKILLCRKLHEKMIAWDHPMCGTFHECVKYMYMHWEAIYPEYFAKDLCKLLNYILSILKCFPCYDGKTVRPLQSTQYRFTKGWRIQWRGIWKRPLSVHSEKTGAVLKCIWKLHSLIQMCPNRWAANDSLISGSVCFACMMTVSGIYSFKTTIARLGWRYFGAW